MNVFLWHTSFHELCNYIHGSETPYGLPYNSEQFAWCAKNPHALAHHMSLQHEFFCVNTVAADCLAASAMSQLRIRLLQSSIIFVLYRAYHIHACAFTRSL